MRRRTGEDAKVEMNMTPMIDVVFQLLTFFMFTLKPMIHEGQFAVSMAAAAGAASPEVEEFKIPPLAVYLKATGEGELAAILLGDREVRGFDDLRIQVQMLAGGAMADEIEAEIHADDALQYTHLIGAVNALTAAKISKINFAGGGS
jgi:biopolymer transport protein ExbD